MVLILFPALLAALAASREHENGTMIQVYASTLSAPRVDDRQSHPLHRASA